MKLRLIREKTSVGAVPLLILRPKRASEKLPGLLWIHGGGYSSGMPAMALVSRAREAAEKYGAVVISPGYRLSGRAPYPAALEDCMSALRYMKDNAERLGIRDDQLFVGGESAGGGLAAALCMLALDSGGPAVAGHFPLYPMLYFGDTPSSRDNHGHMWNTRKNHAAWKKYLRSLKKGEPVPQYASPALREDMTGMPPAYTFVGDGEPFYCETLEYAEKLRRAGAEAEADVFHTDVHGFDLLLPMSKSAKLA
ncbi:MAG: alpha/beta hydrolase, partial [Oscillospiraceae bacterium]|nr:alpha/beta hydrolase [Oscillospiraceae bacterium]